MCAAAKTCQKSVKFLYFGSSRSFKVIDVHAVESSSAVLVIMKSTSYTQNVKNTTNGFKFPTL